ncbi:lytic transglycosylase domain-containing protein [Azospirillum sp. sgz302134]
MSTAVDANAADFLSPAQVKQRQLMAQMLMGQMNQSAGTGGGAVLGKAIQGALAGWMMGSAMNAEQEGQGRSAKALIDYLNAADASPAPAPTGGTVTTPKADAIPPATPAPVPKVDAPQPIAQVPEIYRSHVQDAAAAYGVNPITLANMLMAESGGRVNATSSAGAQGIMQFMPATAKQYGVDVTDPKSSIDGAAHYLSDLTKQFGGDERKAVAAYNAGPGRVQEAGGDLSKLPAETQAYVPKVLGAAPAPVQVAQANAGTITDAAPTPGAQRIANPAVVGSALAPQAPTPSGQNALLAKLLSDPWTRDMGMQFALAGIKSKQEMQIQIQKMLAENQIKLATEPALAKAKAEAENPAMIARAGGEAEAKQMAELQYAPQIAGLKEQAVQAAQQPGKAFDREGKLRDDFNGLQPVKNWREVVPIYGSMVDAMGRDDPAADLNIVYGIAKIMDPASVVREGETQMAVATGSPAERFAGMFNYVANGGRLTTEMREKLLTEATSRLTGHQDAYGQIVRQFEDNARAASLDPRRVITDVQLPRSAQDRINAARSLPAPSPQAPQAAPQQQQPQGQPPRISADAAGKAVYDALPSGAVFVAPDGTTRRKP